MAFFTKKPVKNPIPQPFPRCPKPVPNSVEEAILSEIQEIRRIMSTTPTPITYTDLQVAITRFINSTTASNNAVSSQVAEVKQLLIDYAAALAKGQPITQEQLQAAISQLGGAQEAVDVTTKTVQDSAAAIASVDPNAAPQPVPEPVPEPAP